MAQVYVIRRASRAGGRALYTTAELADIAVRLKRFMRANFARCGCIAAVARPQPPTLVRVVRVTTPPPAAPETLTMVGLASANAA